MKFLATVVVLVAVSFGGFFLWQRAPSMEAGNNSSARATTAAVEPRDIHFTVNAAGDIGPADQVSVRPEVNGRIAELPVEFMRNDQRASLVKPSAIWEFLVNMARSLRRAP